MSEKKRPKRNLLPLYVVLYYLVLPVVLGLLVFGFVVVFTQGTSVAPFVYTLF